MNDDLISRQATLEKFADVFNGTINTIMELTFNECRSFLDDLPTVSPRWIPVTERLPMKSGNYLVTWEATEGCTPTVQMMHFYQYLGGFGDAVKHILAWMPLPAPWKGESDGQRTIVEN